MSALEDAILGPLEAASASLGLRTPGSRALVAAGLTAGGLWLAKPALMFDKAGAPRSDSPVQWWLLSSLVGVATFILV
jgi:hypothetical protein